MALPPSRVPEVNLNDDQDPAQELGQRVAGVAQQVQGSVQTVAFTAGGRAARGRQQEQGRQREERRDELDTAAGRREEARENRGKGRREPAGEQDRVEDLAIEDVPPPMGPEQRGQQEHAVPVTAAAPRLALVPDDAEVSRAAEALQADRDSADDAANASAQWAQNDDNPQTIAYIGSTNPRAKRGTRTADARGDSNEQVGEEAHLDAGRDIPAADYLRADYLKADYVSQDPMRGDPLLKEPGLGPAPGGVDRYGPTR